MSGIYLDQSNRVFSLNQLIDLSLNTPDSGTVNFRVLRIALKIIVRELNLDDVYARIFIKDLQVPAELLDEEVLDSHLKKHGLITEDFQNGHSNQQDLRKRIVKRAELTTSEGEEVPVERTKTEEVVVFDYQFDEPVPEPRTPDSYVAESQSFKTTGISNSPERDAPPERSVSLTPETISRSFDFLPQADSHPSIGGELPSRETPSFMSLAAEETPTLDNVDAFGVTKLSEDISAKHNEKAEESEEDKDYYIEKHGTGSYIELYGSDGNKIFQRTGKLQEDMERAFKRIADELDSISTELDIHKHEYEMKNQENAKNSEEFYDCLKELIDTVNKSDEKVKELVKDSEYIQNKEAIEGRLDELSSKVAELQTVITDKQGKLNEIINEILQSGSYSGKSVEVESRIQELDSKIAKMSDEEAEQRIILNAQKVEYKENTKMLETRLNDMVEKIAVLSNFEESQNDKLIQHTQEFYRNKENVQDILNQIQRKIAELERRETEQKHRLCEQNEEYLRNKRIVHNLIDEINAKMSELTKLDSRHMYDDEICVARFKEVIHSLLDRIKILEETPLFISHDHPEFNEIPENEIGKRSANGLATSETSSTTTSYPYEN